MSSSTPASGSASGDVLAQRYGSGHRILSPRGRRGPSFKGWVIIAAIATLLSAAFVVWIVQGQSSAPVAKDVSFQVQDAANTYADFDLTKDSDQTVTCAVRALNEQYAIVGWNEVTIGEVAPEELNGRTSTHRVPVRTTNEANSVGVDSCWTVD
ncbi:MAG: DUF4307 domain-containing protein [Kocuria sp.]|nr:DUF4307 domain-containing protein [Kocuria sp.]